MDNANKRAVCVHHNRLTASDHLSETEYFNHFVSCCSQIGAVLELPGRRWVVSGFGSRSFKSPKST
eukprot:5301847-Amphidinium_carterae.1